MPQLILVSDDARQTAKRMARPRRGGAPPLADYREEVQELLVLDTPFREIEDAIAETDLPADQKASLWLLAWSVVSSRGDEEGEPLAAAG
jgi:hypothetical protein